MKKELTIEENIILLDFLGESIEVNKEGLLSNIKAIPYQRGYTPTEIGQQIEPRLSAVKVNKILSEMDFQVKCNDEWIPTEMGMPYALQGGYSIIKTDKGSFLKTKLLWNGEVINILKKKQEIDNQGEETAC